MKIENQQEQQNRPEKKLIDLEKIIKSKNPKLLVLLPRFILNYIKKIIHQNEINRFLLEHGDKYDLDFIKAVLEEFGVKVNVVGKEYIPEKGGYIFAANHPLGGIDALVLMNEISKIRKDIKFIVNDILLSLENLKSMFIPVNKHGRNSPEILEKIEKTYTSEEAILVFPAGLVSRKQSKMIKDLEWKKSFITMAKKYKKNIIPVYIEGRNTNFFYALSRWRKILGIKANIEMFFLADEMYKQKNKTISLIFGKPISYETFDKTLNDRQWAEKIKEHVYSLGEEKPLPLNTVQ